MRSGLFVIEFWQMKRHNKRFTIRREAGGFRCWRAGVLAEVVKEPFKARDFAFQLEALYRAKQTGVRITEVPIDYRQTNSTFKPAMLVEALKIYLNILTEVIF